jgi:menaquinone-dependent protoporphyrinogen oxidase
MKVLVTVASRYGATQEIGDAIGQVLAGHGLDVTVARAEGLNDVRRYDAVVLGSAVYMGRWLPAARVFLEEYGEELARRPTWLFSSGPLGSPLRPREEEAVRLGPIWGKTRAIEHRLFGGKLEKSLLSFGERAVMHAVRAPEGDFRDWDEVRSWADSIAGLLVTADQAPVKCAA